MNLGELRRGTFIADAAHISEYEAEFFRSQGKQSEELYYVEEGELGKRMWVRVVDEECSRRHRGPQITLFGGVGVHDSAPLESTRENDCRSEPERMHFQQLTTQQKHSRAYCIRIDTFTKPTKRYVNQYINQSPSQYATFLPCMLNDSQEAPLASQDRVAQAAGKAGNCCWQWGPSQRMQLRAALGGSGKLGGLFGRCRQLLATPIDAATRGLGLVGERRRRVPSTRSADGRGVEFEAHSGPRIPEYENILVY